MTVQRGDERLPSVQEDGPAPGSDLVVRPDVRAVTLQAVSRGVAVLRTTVPELARRPVVAAALAATATVGTRLAVRIAAEADPGPRGPAPRGRAPWRSPSPRSRWWCTTSSTMSCTTSASRPGRPGPSPPAGDRPSEARSGGGRRRPRPGARCRHARAPSGRLRLEAVAHARLGEQVARPGRVRLELAPQLRHVDPQVARRPSRSRVPTPRSAAGAGSPACPGAAAAPRAGATRSG